MGKMVPTMPVGSGRPLYLTRSGRARAYDGRHVEDDD